MTRLTIVNNGRVEASLTFDADEILIGRQLDADIHLADHAVSRRHARLHRGGAGFEVEDLGSVNGVTVGGRRVRRWTLEPGDEIGIETYKIVYEPADDLYREGLERSRPKEASPDYSRTYVSLSGLSRPAPDDEPG